MLATRLATRSSRLALAQCRNSLLLLGCQKQPQVPNLYNQYHSLLDYQQKVIPGQVSLLHHLNLCGSALQRFGISSSASPQPNDKDASQSGNEQGSASENGAAAAANKSTDATNEKDVSESDSGSDSEIDLSMDELVKLVAEKEEELKVKHEELQKMQDKALRTYAEMQNSMNRTKREAENLKKFAVQDFAKSLLDVADNLGRASSVVKDSFAKIDESKDDAAGAVPLLRTLLEGVAMTEKQLAEVFKKYGVEKYDPVNEEFDPHRHNAVFQVPDPSKPPNTVAIVLKPGYRLHDRVIRPAEVGVTQAVENKEE